MNFKDYQEETKRTAPFLGSEFLDQLHMAIGMSTETGELLDAYKKAFAYGKPLDLINIQEELGDLLWYASNLMRMLDLNFETVLDVNVQKLRARYKVGFSEEEALNRDLDKEREILEINSSDKARGWIDTTIIEKDRPLEDDEFNTWEEDTKS